MNPRAFGRSEIWEIKKRGDNGPWNGLGVEKEAKLPHDTGTYPFLSDLSCFE